MVRGGNEEMKALFAFFVQESALFAQAKNIHSKSIVLDSHTDTPMLMDAESDLTIRGEGKVDAIKMEEGKVSATIMAAYLPQGKRTSKPSAVSFSASFFHSASSQCLSALVVLCTKTT